MKPGRLLVPLLVLLTVTLLAPWGLAESSRVDTFAGNPLWDDGRAEVDLYEARETFYGQPREFEARMIVVKEDFRTDLHVKSDAGRILGKTIETLKMNHLRMVPTGSYDYHQMVSVWLDREALRFVKLAMTGFESCGMTFVEILPEGDHLSHASHSYWDGEADRRLSIPFGEGDLLEDALPLYLRGIDFKRNEPLPVSVLPSQLTARVKGTTPVRMTLHVAGRETIQVPAGSFETYRVEVARPEGSDRYYVEAAFPHLLVELETAQGRLYRLKKTLRLDYWNHHAVGDEQLLK